MARKVRHTLAHFVETDTCKTRYCYNRGLGCFQMINLSSLKLGEEAIEVFYAGRYKHNVPAK